MKSQRSVRIPASRTNPAPPFLPRLMWECCFALTLVPVLAQASQAIPTGRYVSELAGLDAAVQTIMRRYNIPGAALAVVNGRTLVLARGYGVADQQARTPVNPHSRFRIASVSKSFTAAAVLKLVQLGKLNLESNLGDLAPELFVGQSVLSDSRIKRVTINQLLHHTAGWSRTKTGDTAFWYRTAIDRFGALTPINMHRMVASVPLQTDPGAVVAYSNAGYELLGYVIERLSGKPYPQWVTEEILQPAGISAMSMSATLASQRQDDEVSYYDYDGAGLRPSVVSGIDGWLPRPYGGGILMEYCSSYGGWLASAPDVARFLVGLDGRRGDPLLPATLFRSMLAPPASLPEEAAYLGKGWVVRPVGPDRWSWWMTGALPGSTSFAVNFSTGVSYVLLFNSRPPASEAADDPFWGDVDSIMNTAFGKVSRFPEFDLFEVHPPSVPATHYTSIGRTVPISISLTDPDGQADLRTGEVFVGNGIGLPQSCHFGYRFATTELFLQLDDGNWSSVAAGSPAGLRNSQCAIDSSSFRVPGPLDESLTFHVTFATQFVGTKKIFGMAEDRSGSRTTWVPLGERADGVGVTLGEPVRAEAR